jgi:hypothetical protein
VGFGALRRPAPRSSGAHLSCTNLALLVHPNVFRPLERGRAWPQPFDELRETCGKAYPVGCLRCCVH